MISHHLLQLLLLTDWTKRETDPTETFRVFFFCPAVVFVIKCTKKHETEHLTLAWICSSDVCCFCSTAGRLSVLSDLFITPVYFPFLLFFWSKRLHFCLPECNWKKPLPAAVPRVEEEGVVVTFLNIWRLHEDDVVGVKFKGRSNYISAPPLTSALHFLILQPFYELWRVFVPRGSGSVLTRCSSAGDCADFLNVESLMRE